MSQYVRAAERTFEASAALSQYRRVRLNGSGKLVYAGAADADALGELSRNTFADGELVAVVLKNAEGTRLVVASEAIGVGAAVFAAANGKVAASGTVLVGESLEAATADGDVIEIL